MKRVQRLQDEFNTPPLYGRHVEWAGYTLHDAATILRRYLISLPESVISVEHYSAFLEKLAESLPDDVKARDYGALIATLTPEARNTLLYILELLSVFARSKNSSKTLMNASNLAAVLQPCLLVHPGHVADPQEYGKAKDVVEFLIAHAPKMYGSQDAHARSPGLHPTADSDGSTPAAGAGAGAGADAPGEHGGGEDHASAGDRRASKATRELLSGDSIGAGLIVFESEDTRNSEGYRSRFMASDDGTTLTTYGGNAPPSARTISGGQLNRWSSPQRRESGLTAVHSSESVQQAHLGIGIQSASADAFNGNLPAPPPRGDSLAAMSLVMSTPVMGRTEPSHAPQPRSLDPVTARLYDPSVAPQPLVKPVTFSGAGSPDMQSEDSPLTGSFGGWHTNSGIALNSIQYQYTTGNASLVGQSKVSPRPRRSISLVTASGLRDFVQEIHREASKEHGASDAGEPYLNAKDGEGGGSGIGVREQRP
ncbi:GTPase activating protein (GAP) for Rho1p [Coemansia sp. RSA 1804]|nr:GTPase activating protein (GAP) for Rho1p [Coemansia sp. RSA 1804]